MRPNVPDHEPSWAWTPDLVTAEPRFQRNVTCMAVPTWHLDGVAWYDVQAPPLRHKHWTQTVGELGAFSLIQRCGCGATFRLYSGPGRWIEERQPRIGDGPVRSWWRRLAA